MLSNKDNFKFNNDSCISLSNHRHLSSKPQDCDNNCNYIPGSSMMTGSWPPFAPLFESAVRSPRIIPDDKSEVFITGFMPLHISTSLHSLSFAILKAHFPSLERDDIRAVKIVPSHSEEGTMKDSAGASSFFIVRRRTPQLAKSVVN